MRKDKLKYHLLPSGLNHKFYGSNLAFSEYIQLMQDIILEARIDLVDHNATQIVTANSPFSCIPATQKPKNGILLIHGLFDSPYYVRDLADYFKNKGFLVQAILLPGHGTVPGDLLNLHYTEWTKCVDYGIKTLAKAVENVFIGGYSLGGALAVNHVLEHPNDAIKSILLFAPALKPKNILKNLLAKHYRLFGWISSRTKWYQLGHSTNFAKYNCLCINAGHQACNLIKAIEAKADKNRLNLPLFTVASSDDETISSDAIVNFFLKQPHPKNKMLLYTNKSSQIANQKIVKRGSAFPEHKILNFSHICITIAPDNFLLGRQSQIHDLNHYPKNYTLNRDNLYFGAINQQNLKNHQVLRLSYNPDFNHMLQELDVFLQSIDEAISPSLTK